MARGDRALARSNRKIQQLATDIQGNVDKLYRTTYLTNPENEKRLSNLQSRIADNIDRVTKYNVDMKGTPTVSKIYSRINDSSHLGKKDIGGELNSLFEDTIFNEDLYTTFMNNRYLRELDDEIDTILKYMPKLEEALNTKKDNILSADNFTKDFLTIRSRNVSETDSSTFNERVKEMKKKYNLLEFVEEVYEKAAKYGERFVYIVPYSTAIKKLLVQKPDTITNAFKKPGTFGESVIQEDGKPVFDLILTHSGMSIINESSKTALLTESAPIAHKPYRDSKIKTGEKLLKGEEKLNIKIELGVQGFIESAVSEVQSRHNKRKNISKMSMQEQHLTMVNESKNKMAVTTEAKDKLDAAGNLSLDGIKMDRKELSLGYDGLSRVDQQDIDKIKIDAPGVVLKQLKREHVVPIYMGNDMCMGYYYFEIKSNDISDELLGFKNITGDPMSSLRGGKQDFNYIGDKEREEEIVRYVAGYLSQFIDKAFINNNQDLTKEIYQILKYNDLYNSPNLERIKITFVPPEDIQHVYFKLDEDSHRGISDLANALVPAKMFTSLYAGDVIGKMTRGYDKRVYYVKQNIEQNIAQTLMNTINQIKQGNFGIRQFNNINNVLNITGRFNDFVIPKGPSGDPPIEFEIMPGQQFDTPTELLDKLEEMAINSTEVPLEIIQSRQSVDYAMQLTMSSSKFLRTAYKRQGLYELVLDRIITKIYNYEYDENLELEVKLPPPAFINIANTTQIVDNTKNMVQSLVDMEMEGNDDDKLKAEYNKLMFFHYIGTHVDTSTHAALYKKAKNNIAANKKEGEE